MQIAFGRLHIGNVQGIDFNGNGFDRGGKGINPTSEALPPKSISSISHPGGFSEADPIIRELLQPG